jgi:hypothetical protein
MSRLRFSFQNIINELDAFSELADKFISHDTRYVLPHFRTALEGYRDGDRTSRWVWAIAQPLKSRVSKGGYEVGAGGQHHVVAVIDAMWEIQKVAPKKGEGRRPKFFELVGVASTRVRLFCEANGSRELGMWRMEIGDAAAPGCHFHIQVLGEHPESPFPNSLPVPRFPSVLLTPPAVTEFVLAEIFQDDWARHVGRDSPEVQRWGPIQRDRLTRLLEWNLEVARMKGSPWSTIKNRKPQPELFVS